MALESDKLKVLRERRARALGDQKSLALRDSYGGKYAAILAEATGASLNVDDFSPEPIQFDWPKDIREAEGLVAAYISRTQATELLHCLDQRLGKVSGKIGFHGKDYLGMADVAAVSVSTLIVAAEEAQDSVILRLLEPDGWILVDCYRAPLVEESFSVVVQGEELSRAIAHCFM